MKAGSLRHRVTIQSRSMGQDDYGQPLNTWQDITSVWADIEDLSGREWFQGQQIPSSQVSVRVTIRYRPDIKPDMRLLVENRVLDIKAVLDPTGRRQNLQLMCQEVIPNGS